MHIDALGHAVEGRVFCHQFQGGSRVVDTMHLTSPSNCRLDTPATDVAVDVQHATIATLAAEARPVFAMIVEPAGLLALPDRHCKLHPVLGQGQALWHLSVYHVDLAGKALLLAAAAI